MFYFSRKKRGKRDDSPKTLDLTANDESKMEDWQSSWLRSVRAGKKGKEEEFGRDEQMD